MPPAVHVLVLGRILKTYHGLSEGSGEEGDRVKEREGGRGRREGRSWRRRKVERRRAWNRGKKDAVVERLGRRGE